MPHRLFKLIDMDYANELIERAFKPKVVHSKRVKDAFDFVYRTIKSCYLECHIEVAKELIAGFEKLHGPEVTEGLEILLYIKSKEISIP